MTSIACGTYAGYQLHGRAAETPCRDCKDAAAAYIRHLRARHAGLDSDTRAEVLHRILQRHPSLVDFPAAGLRLTLGAGECA